MQNIDQILEINLLSIRNQKENKNILAIVKIYKRILDKTFNYMKENNIEKIKDLKDKYNSKQDFYLIFQDLLEEYLWLGKQDIEVNQEIINYINTLKENNIEYTDDIKLLLNTSIARATNEFAHIKEAEDMMKEIIKENKNKSYVYFVLAGIYVDNGELTKAKELLLSSKNVEDLDLPNIIDEYIQTIDEQILRQAQLDKFYSDADDEEEYDSFWDD